MGMDAVLRAKASARVDNERIDGGRGRSMVGSLRFVLVGCVSVLSYS